MLVVRLLTYREVRRAAPRVAPRSPGYPHAARSQSLRAQHPECLDGGYARVMGWAARMSRSHPRGTSTVLLLAGAGAFSTAVMPASLQVRNKNRACLATASLALARTYF